MKTLLLAAALALALSGLRAADAPAPLDAAFQEALLLEEGRRDLPAARRAYEAVVAQVDAQRSLAATAVFRLGEVHRKLAQTNEAVAQYRRLLLDFPAEETLAKLSRENLAALGAPVAERGGDVPVVPQGRDVRGAPPRDPGPAVTPPSGSAAAAEEIARLEAQVALFEQQPLDAPATLIALQQAFPDEQLARLEEAILEARRRLGALEATPAEQHPDVRAARRQVVELLGLQQQRVRAVLDAQRLRLRALKAALPVRSGGENAGQSSATAELTALEAQVAELSAQLAQLVKIDNEQNAFDDAVILLLQWFPDAELAGLDAKWRTAGREIEKLGVTLKPDHPTMVAVLRERDLLAKQRRERWISLLRARSQQLQVMQDTLKRRSEQAAAAAAIPADTSALAAQVNDLRRRSPLEPGALAEFLAAFPDAELDRLGRQLRDAEGRLNALGGRTDDNASDHDSAQSAVSGAQAVLRSRWQAVLDAQALRAEAGGGDGSTLEAAEIARLTQLIAQSPDLLNAPAGEPRQTPLQRAAAAGQLAVVKFLLARGADVNARGVFNSTALHSAAYAGHRAVVEALLDAGADPNAWNGLAIPESVRETPLIAAAGRGLTAVVETLLARGADPNLPDENGRTPLIAASGGFPAVVEILLNRGAVVTTARQSGYPNALHEAVFRRNLASVERLLKAGAAVNASAGTFVPGWPRGTPLAVALGHSPVSRPLVEMLIRAGAVVSEPPGDHNPLTLALGKGDPALLELVLTAKPTNGFPAGLLDDALLSAAENGHADAIAPLIRAGASPEARRPNGWSAVLIAADKAPILAALLPFKPDVNQANEQGQTALHLAALSANTNALRLLLDAGADPNRLNSEGQAPLNLVLARLRKQQGALPGQGLGAAGAGRPGAAPESANWQTTEALLRAAGAREDLPRRQWILLRRGQHEEWFFRRAGDDPPPRLADILVQLYGWPKQGQNQPAQFAWQDFTALRVHRLAADGLAESELPVAADWPTRPDCEWNIPLAWGDALEIPEADHPQTAGWQGLAEAEAAALHRCTHRKVTVTVKDKPAALTLLPANVGAGAPGQRRGAPAGAVSGIASCRLGEVLKASGLLRTSSDVTRVEVTRATGQTWALDVQNDPRALQFWLLDGDRIVVPEARP